MTKKKESIVSLYGLTDDFDRPYFSLDFLVKNMLGMSSDDLKENQETKDKIKEEKKKMESQGESTGSEQPPMGGESPEPPVEEPETPTETAPE